MNDIRKILESIENIDPKTDIENVFLGDLKHSPEKNTEVENQISKIIQQYTNFTGGPGAKTEGDAIKAKLIPILKQLQKLKHLYPNDLITNTDEGGYVYRGKSIHIDDWHDMCTYAEENLEINPFAEWLPYYYKPTYEIQSWSTSWKTAVFFSNFIYDPDKRSPVIMRVKPDDSFIFSSKLLNLFLPGLNQEHEVMRISIKPIELEIRLIDRDYHY